MTDRLAIAIEYFKEYSASNRLVHLAEVANSEFLSMLQARLKSSNKKLAKMEDENPFLVEILQIIEKE